MALEVGDIVKLKDGEDLSFSVIDVITTMHGDKKALLWAQRADGTEIGLAILDLSVLVLVERALCFLGDITDDL